MYICMCIYIYNLMEDLRFWISARAAERSLSSCVFRASFFFV